MVFWEEKVGINVLKLDERNPRLPQSKDQEDAINQMLYRHEKKIRAISRHISEFGLNPSTLPLIFRNSEGEYIVKDGNRRITAIKCMMYPNKIKNNPRLKKYLSDLGEGLDRSEFQYIDCRVSDDEVEINRWVEINHQGEQGGIGQSKWDAVAKARNLRASGQPQPNLDLFDYLVDKLSFPVDEDEFDFTTFERIVKNSKFKEAIGMEHKSDEIVFNRPESEWLRDFEEVLNNMTSDKDNEGHIDSRTLNTKEDIEAYVNKKREEGFFEPSTDSAQSAVSINTDPWVPSMGAKKKSPRTSKKVTLIGKDCIIFFPKPRMNDMFVDLKTFDLMKHSNSASAVFRTLFEMTTKYYFDNMPKPNGMAADRYVNFPDRIEMILAHLRKNGRISEDTKKSVECLLNNKDPIVLEFSQFGHNCEYNPTHQSLVNLWNSMESFMLAMYPSIDAADDENK